MDADIYVALVEVALFPGCQIDPKQFGGAAVRCYVSADSNSVAIEKLTASLAADLFRVVNVEWCVEANSVEWENADNESGLSLENEVRETGEVVFGEFHTWPIEGP